MPCASSPTPGAASWWSSTPTPCRLREIITPVKLRTIWLVAALAALSLGGTCGYKTPNYDYASEPDPRTMEYVLGIGDELTINVWEKDNLSSDAVIRPDGTITMPLIGDLKAVGE